VFLFISGSFFAARFLPLAKPRIAEVFTLVGEQFTLTARAARRARRHLGARSFHASRRLSRVFVLTVARFSFSLSFSIHLSFAKYTGTQGGSVVEVEGSFDGWQTRTQLHRSGNREFSVIKSFPPGVYQYKFIVDGEWKYAPDQPAMYDEMGNVNNVLEVQEYVPEILDNLDHFAAPSSPKESYDDYLFHGEDFSKEPPAMPPQLKLTLLNMPPIPYAPNLLPRPQHVVLNHAYVDQSKAKQGLSVIGTTHRYRAKYVTIVLMKSSNSQQDC
jgi:5'-AMP-activated protein kinase regulatory beta subunit